MTNDELNNRIHKAFSGITPDILDSVRKDCDSEKGVVISMEKTTNRKKWATRMLVTAASFMILLSGLGIYTYTNKYKPISTVSLDVNPGIEIKLNKNDSVLKVLPLNEDGKKVIGNMNFKNSDLEVTVNALVGSMLKNGYLSNLSNSILVSVDSSNNQKSQEIQKKLSMEIDDYLKTEGVDGTVLSQIVSDDAAQELAEKYGISLGKAQLINKFISANPKYAAADLVKMTVNELNILAQNINNNINDLQQTGKPSEKAYISSDEAKAAALAKANVAESDIRDLDCELDMHKGMIVYEVEFEVKDMEYEVIVDAKNGNVIDMKTKKDTNSNDDHDDKDDDDKENDKDDIIPEGNYISEQEVKNIVLKHSGFAATDIQQFVCKLENDHGIVSYDVDFKNGKYEYDYKIDAKSGKILKHDKEIDDDIS